MKRPSTYEIAVKIFKLYGACRDEEIRDRLIDIAMDVSGIPDDNTVETEACDYANKGNGKWPVWAYCRDIGEENLRKHDGFPERQASLAIILGEESHVHLRNENEFMV